MSLQRYTPRTPDEPQDEDSIGPLAQMYTVMVRAFRRPLCNGNELMFP